MARTISIHDFTFQFEGYGHYRVTYTSPATSRSWTTICNCMPMIDATKNAEEPKKKDLEALKKFCKKGWA